MNPNESKQTRAGGRGGPAAFGLVAAGAACLIGAVALSYHLTHRVVTVPLAVHGQARTLHFTQAEMDRISAEANRQTRMVVEEQARREHLRYLRPPGQ